MKNLTTPPLLALSIAALSPLPAAAQSFDDVLTATLLPGWRQADGTHMAAMQLDLAPGWHTYWRAPGDAGIPPLFDTSRSSNLRGSQVVWPRPEVFHQNGMRSIGYKGRVVLPMQLSPKQRGSDITLQARIDIGVCDEICIPKTLNVSAVLPASASSRDARIVAALTDRPYTAREMGIAQMRCQISPGADGMTLATQFTMDPLGRRDEVVIEAGDPLLWVAEPEVSRSGRTVTAVTEIQHVEGAPFVLGRDNITVTVLGAREAVEIKGCTR